MVIRSFSKSWFFFQNLECYIIIFVFVGVDLNSSSLADLVRKCSKIVRVAIDPLVIYHYIHFKSINKYQAHNYNSNT